MAFMFGAGWFMFVPKVVEYSERQFQIETLINSAAYDWDQLNAFGSAGTTFKILFIGDRQAYQILAGAYPKEEWSQFIQFLRQRVPDREARVWIGVRPFRK